MFGDSGFLCIYEPLIEIFRHTGNRSLIYLDPRYAEAFDARNDPEVTGVFPIYAPTRRNPAKLDDGGFDERSANLYFDGMCPVDYVITNKAYIIPHLAAQCHADKNDITPLPLVYIVLNAGRDGNINPVSGLINTTKYKQIHSSTFHLYAEACAYLMSSLVVWTTDDQFWRGMKIAKHFLSSVELVRLSSRAMINGCGITDLLIPHKKPDEQVRSEMQARKEDFCVTFIGRASANKNVKAIFDVMFPLFARHGIKLAMRSLKGVKSSKRLVDVDDAANMVSNEIFLGGFASREDYAGKLLPSIQCMIYASIAEGYCITPREAVYIGVPVLVPRRPWAVAAFGDDYPFFWSSDSQAIALIKRIEEGRVSDDEIDRFLCVRESPRTCEFISHTAMKLFGAVTAQVDARREHLRSYPHSNLLRVFETVTKVGEKMRCSSLCDRLESGGFGVRVNSLSSSAFSPPEICAILGNRLNCLDPAAGLFERTA
jgi:hypothetical protein